MPCSLLHLECSDNEQKGFFSLSMPNYHSGLGAGSKRHCSARGRQRQAMCAVVPMEDVSAVWGSTAVQRQVLLRMRKRSSAHYLKA